MILEVGAQVGEWGGGVYIYVSNTAYTDHHKDSALSQMGSNVSQVNVLLLVRQKVTCNAYSITWKKKENWGGLEPMSIKEN